MPLVLYGTHVSPPTRAVMMLLDILNIDVNFKEINLPTRDHYKKEYLEKNPLHTVPMMEDDEFRIVDSHAILTYLCTKFGKEDLYPSDLKTRCSIDQRLYFDATILFPRLRSVIYDVTQRKGSGLAESRIKDIEEAYSVTENYLQKTKYIATDDFTVADISCVATISSLNEIHPVSGKHVKINEWWSKLKERRWYEKNVLGNTTFGYFMKSYDFNYSNYTKWMAIDIGFAIVEKPYDFSDLTYRLQCSYVPKPITINFDSTYTEADQHMMIYGWGHSRGLRTPGDTTNYNSLYLQAASTKTASKLYCKGFFERRPLKTTIAKYMICTIGAGNLDSEGNIIDPGKYNYDNGCSRKQMGVDGRCNHDYDSFESRRNGSDTKNTFNSTSGHQYNRTAKTNETRRRGIPTRRQGICTNDHGGPLVTWVGSKEVVVGVASSSLYDENYFCIAPSLYTSTHCVMRFLMCGLQMGKATSEDGRRLCKNLKKEEGYELDERDVDWGGYTVNSSEKNNSKYSYGMPEKFNHQDDTQNVDLYTSDNPYKESAIDLLEQDTDDLDTIVDVI